jgi:polar amino acid transport system permease protein
VAGFISFFRNTPPLVQIYFFYFGLGYLLPRIPDGSGATSPLISNFQWAVISLSLFAGAFNIEIFRSGIEAIPKATAEAGTSLGLSRWQNYRLVVLPMAIRVCLPALGNNLVNLVKTTNLAYAIAVPELLYVSKQIWSDATNVREMMIFVLVAYLALVFVLLVPERATDVHLQILSELAQMFSDRDFRARLTTAPDALAAQKMIVGWQAQAPNP